MHTPMFRPGLFLPCLLLAASAWSADEAPYSYRVELQAPSEVRSLLEKYLEIFKWRDDKRTTPEQVVRILEHLPGETGNLLATVGYFSPKVSQKFDEKSAVVSITVEPGELTYVDKVNVNVHGDIEKNPTRFKQLSGYFERRGNTLEGEPFTQDGWSELKKRALSILSSRQYPAARITDSRAEIDPQSRMAELTIDMDSGPLYTFGDISISGLSRYPEKLISNSVNIEPGSEYNRSKMLDLQTELQNMPQFATALVDASVTPDEPHVAPVNIEVQEAPANKVNTGLGYSTNTGFRGELGYRYLNLFNQGWVWDSKLRLEQKEQAVDLGITLPKASNSWTHSGFLSYLHSDVEGLDTTSYKTGIARTKTENNIDRTILLQYQTEHRVYNDGTVEDPKALTLNFKWIQRALDSQKNPRSGYLVQGEVGGASEALGSSTNFLRVYGRGIKYTRLWNDLVLVTQLEAGETFANDPSSVSTDWLFRAGGTGSVRGYDYQSLGINANGSVVAGRVLATGSVELQYPVIKDWRGAIFVDHGGAGDNWRTLDMVTGAGVGARWQSPVGQIGMDIAYGIDARQVRFHFVMGMAF